MKGYMRIEPCPYLDNKITTAWYYDQEDPDETTFVLDLHQVFMVADQNGTADPLPASDPAALGVG
jgi:hypothetical protein